MRVSIIVAAATNDVIGKNNELPWRLSSDLRRFKHLTMGHHLIVGRRTWESIGRPLPGRRMIVVSRSTPELPPGVVSAGSLAEALHRARDHGESETFVAGGAEVYALALPVADRLYLTRVHEAVEGDVVFPEVSWGDWQLVESEEGVVDERSPLPHTFLTYDRAAPS
jgi:dihydrofolate reductase